MTTLLLAWSITTAQVMLGFAMACAAYRLLFGPRAQAMANRVPVSPNP